jgi:hypothetical protein
MSDKPMNVTKDGDNNNNNNSNNNSNSSSLVGNESKIIINDKNTNTNDINILNDNKKNTSTQSNGELKVDGKNGPMDVVGCTTRTGRGRPIKPKADIFRFGSVDNKVKIKPYIKKCTGSIEDLVILFPPIASNVIKSDKIKTTSVVVFSPGSNNHPVIPVLIKKRKVVSVEGEGKVWVANETMADNILQRLGKLENDYNIIVAENIVLRETIAHLKVSVENKEVADIIKDVSKGLEVVQGRLNELDAKEAGVGQSGSGMMDVDEGNVEGSWIDRVRGNRGSGSKQDIESKAQAAQNIKLCEAKLINYVTKEAKDRQDKSGNIVLSGLCFPKDLRAKKRNGGAGIEDIKPIRDVVDDFLNRFNDDGETFDIKSFTIQRITMMKNSPLVVDKVIIGVGSSELRDKIIKVVKPQLKGKFKGEGVYITTDKTVNELQLEYSLRQELKIFMASVPEVEHGKCYYYIHDKNIYKVNNGSEERVKVYSA